LEKSLATGVPFVPALSSQHYLFYIFNINSVRLNKGENAPYFTLNCLVVG
jgi:hypothetical protein